MSIDEKPGWVRLFCAGGCGRHVELRSKKVEKHHFYVCNSKLTSAKCLSNLPPRLDGQIMKMVFHAAGAFMGISYVWPDEEQMASVVRARNNLATGLTKMAIEQAMKP